MRKLIFIVSLVLFAFIFPFSAQSTRQVDYAALDDYIAKAIKNFELPGLAIGIFKDSTVVFQKGYGLREIGKKDKITPRSVFAIASCSKAFTAACIGILVDKGKIKWDDKVIDLLPEFQLHDPYITRELTIRDLLCHRCGLATFDGDLLWYGTSYNRKEVMHRIRHLPIKNSFRIKFGYQNVMYIVTGELIKAVTGKSWDKFVQEKIFQPLEMRSSSTSIKEFKAGQDLALPHVNGKPIPHQNFDNVGPAGSINSNVEDLLKWLQLWLNGGKWKERQILSQKSLDTILSPQTILPLSSSQKRSGIHFTMYGLGWSLMDYSGRKVINHGGGLPGFISNVVMVPEEKLGMVVLTNGMSSLPRALMYKILDSFLNESDRDWASEFLGYQKKREQNLKDKKAAREGKRKKGSKPSLANRDYAGIYNDKMYGKAEIIQDKGKLMLKLIPTEELFTSEMEHWHYNTFRIKFKDPFLSHGFVTFDFNADGDITGFKIDLPNPDLHFHNLNFKRIE